MQALPPKKHGTPLYPFVRDSPALGQLLVSFLDIFGLCEARELVEHFVLALRKVKGVKPQALLGSCET